MLFVKMHADRNEMLFVLSSLFLAKLLPL